MSRHTRYAASRGRPRFDAGPASVHDSLRRSSPTARMRIGGPSWATRMAARVRERGQIGRGKCHVALFDIDSTLLRTRGAGRAAFAETFRAEFDIEAFPRRNFLAWDAAIGPSCGRSSRSTGSRIEPDTWQRFVQGYLQRLQRTLATRRGRLLPGVLPLLQRDPGAKTTSRWVFVTGNVAAGARLKLAHYGIDSFFDFGGYGDHHTDRGGIAADALGAADAIPAERRIDCPRSPTLTTVIGDTPQDVQCARAIAARAVAVATGDFSLSELTATAPDRDVRRPDGSRRHPRDHHRCLSPGAISRWRAVKSASPSGRGEKIRSPNSVNAPA